MICKLQRQVKSYVPHFSFDSFLLASWRVNYMYHLIWLCIKAYRERILKYCFHNYSLRYHLPSACWLAFSPFKKVLSCLLGLLNQVTLYVHALCSIHRHYNASVFVPKTTHWKFVIPINILFSSIIVIIVIDKNRTVLSMCRFFNSILVLVLLFTGNFCPLFFPFL